MHLPRVLPDETLFSRIVRSLSTFEELKERYLKALVDNKCAVIHPYLTADLHKISRFTQESARELYNKQTLRQWFTFFVPYYDEVISDCSSSSTKLLRYCQLSTVREQEPVIVKGCCMCAQADLRNVGVAYWHLHHQIPGVDACHTHGIWLSRYKLTGRSFLKAGFFPDPFGIIKQCEPVAEHFARFAERKLRFIQSNPSKKHDSRNYRLALIENGFATKTGRVKRIALTEALYKLSKKVLLPDNPLRIKTETDLKYTSSLIEGNYAVHPFKHLFMEYFVTQLKQHSEQKLEEKYLVKKGKNTKALDDTCCTLLKNGFSMAYASGKPPVF